MSIDLHSLNAPALALRDAVARQCCRLDIDFDTDLDSLSLGSVVLVDAVVVSFTWSKQEHALDVVERLSRLDELQSSFSRIQPSLEALKQGRSHPLAYVWDRRLRDMVR